MAAAGTSLARITPNRSVKEIGKYSIPRHFASLARSMVVARSLLRDIGTEETRSGPGPEA